MIERHLAHGSDEELGSAYDRATFLSQRRKMIQLWADLLDDLAAGKTLEMLSDTEFATAGEGEMSVVQARALAETLPILITDASGCAVWMRELLR